MKRATVFTLLLVLFISSSCLVLAKTMKSENYELQMGQFNMFAGQKESESYKLVDTGGQLGPGVYKGKGFTVSSGFGYIKTVSPFTFSISDALITFEGLSANEPQMETSELTVGLGSATSYKVEAAENYPLTHTKDKKTTIADFSGDDGKCAAPNKACSWIVSSTYGFGYNLAGDDVAGDFVNKTFFKQFANLSDNEPAVVLMEKINIGGKRKATVTYKINISERQKTGVYENSVIYTAVPGY